jgi:lipid II:glycine glycyltransferase (peptidoglycan interpeptide bridge formation enzyme)
MANKPIIINPFEDKRWDNYVYNHPQGLAYHHSGWAKVIKSTYNYQPFFVGLEQSKTDILEGVVPFFLVNSLLTGKRLVSLPFTSYCNPLVPANNLREIVAFAMEYFKGIDYVELKLLENHNVACANYVKHNSFVTHMIKLDIPLDELFMSFHPTSVRQRIRRAYRNKLKFRIAEQEADLKKFYRLLTLVRRRHGLPPQPYSFYSNMWRHLKPQNMLCVPLVEYEGRVVAGATVLKFKDTFYFEYSASDPKFLKQCPNHMLIWEVIKLAYEEGVKYFDFGRSNITNRSLIEFKERWQAKSKTISHYYSEGKKRTYFEDTRCKRLLSSLNRALPLWLLHLEGKMLYKHFG